MVGIVVLLITLPGVDDDLPCSTYETFWHCASFFDRRFHFSRPRRIKNPILNTPCHRSSSTSKPPTCLLQPATLELRRQLPFTTSSTIKKRKMSRPEDLPRSASPLKRRAPSVPLEDDPNATQDVDMLSQPPAAANKDTPILDGHSIEAVEEDVLEENADSLRDDASTAANVDDADEDLPSLTGLDMDRSSVGETQVGSDVGDIGDIGDDNLAVDTARGDDTQVQDPEQTQEDEKNSAESKDPIQIESSTTNTDEAADSDSKTVDTAATSTSVDGAAKTSKSMLCASRSVLR